MKNSTNRSVHFDYAPEHLQAAFRLGWHDVMLNRGWNKGYNQCAISIQRSYEAGRLTAINALAIGPIPPWTECPRTTEIAMDSAAWAARMTGNPLPPAIAR